MVPIVSLGLVAPLGSACSSPATHPDAGVDAATCGCGPGEVCVQYFDGVCTPLPHRCVTLPPTCSAAPCASCPEILCGAQDGGVTFICNAPSCPDPDGGLPAYDYACYGP